MASNINIDVNAWPSFILRYLFAGVWLTVGWAVASKFLLPHIPGL